MDNQKLNEIFDGIFGEGSFELSADQLDDVSGGVITKDGEKKLKDGLKLAKTLGVSKAEVLKQLPSYFDAMHSMFPETTLKEVKDYINKNWDKI